MELASLYRRRAQNELIDQLPPVQESRVPRTLQYQTSAQNMHLQPQVRPQSLQSRGIMLPYQAPAAFKPSHALEGTSKFDNLDIETAQRALRHWNLFQRIATSSG